MMTANEMAPAVGSQVSASFEGLMFDCQVVDVRFVWGRPQFRIAPLHGSGSKWVEMARIFAPRASAPAGKGLQVAS
jgi:hypothetical protein